MGLTKALGQLASDGGNQHFQTEKIVADFATVVIIRGTIYRANNPGARWVVFSFHKRH